MKKQSITLKKLLTTKHLFNGLFFAAFILLLLYPPAKALLIKGLMKVGLFQPDLSTHLNKSLSADNISFQDAAGHNVSLASLKGKVVFINFWATWCPPCIAELPAVNQMNKMVKNNKNIVIMLVDADGNLNKSLPFMAKHQYDLPLYVASTAIPEDLLGGSIPTTVIIDKHGKMVFHHEGAADYTNSGFIKYINNLSNEK